MDSNRGSLNVRPDRLEVHSSEIQLAQDTPQIDGPQLHEKQLSIVMVSYRDDAEMTSAAERLLNMASVGQVIVVRNDVAADAADLPIARSSRYREIKSPSNLGFGNGFNLAMPYIEGEVTLSLNADVDIDEGVLKKISSLALKRDAIIAPHLFNDSGQEETGRRFYSMWRLALSRSPWRGKVLSMTHGEVDWAIGGCLAMKTKILRDLEGFDKRYFLYFEDVDLCWRAREKGWPTIVIPDRAYHAHARASSRINRTLAWHLASALKFFSAHPRTVVGMNPRRRAT